LEYNITKADPCKLLINVTIERDELTEEEAKMVKRLGKEKEIDGYRRGKAPEELIRQRFRDTIRQEVSGKLIPLAWEDIAKQEKLKPLENPSYRLVSFPDQGPMTVELTAYLAPEVKPVDAGKLHLSSRISTVADDEVSSLLTRIAEEHADRKERMLTAAQEGDVVTFKWEGTPPAGGNTENMEVVIPTEKMTGNIGGQLIGAEKDQVRTISIRYENDFPNKDLAGKTVNALVRILKVEERIIPPIDDELAKDLEFKNLAELREAVKEDLLRTRNMEDRRRLREQALTALREESKIDIPKSLIEWARSGESQDREKSRSEEEVVRDLKERFVISALGEKYQIRVDEDELRLEVNAMAHELGLTEVNESFVRLVYANIYRRKTLEYAVRLGLGEEPPASEPGEKKPEKEPEHSHEEKSSPPHSQREKSGKRKPKKEKTEKD
jgi:trigger factor